MKPRSTWKPLLLALATLLLIGGGLTYGSKPGELRVTFLDVGQGDSAVIETPQGHILIVDAGRVTPEDDMGRRVVVPFLRARGINRVDALLLTHPDADHVGGAVSILERVPVGRLLISGFPSDSPPYRRALDTARRRGVPIVILARGQRLDFHDTVTAEVLNPPLDIPLLGHHPDNNSSLVLRVRCGDTALMLTGDAETESEEDMVRAYKNVRADVLKLGHHGSHTSSSELFLDAVHPQAVIISVGKRNLYGHPHPDVLARLAKRPIRVFRTDRDGAITVVSDGHLLHVTAMHRSSMP